MGKRLLITEDSELFIAVAKMNDNVLSPHHFLMVGMMVAGKPVLLARVGKTNDIDINFSHQLTMTYNVLRQTTKARLADEGVERSINCQRGICYSAFGITLAQYEKFLYMLAIIKSKQDDFYKSDHQLAPDAKSKLDAPIQCYVPVAKDDPGVTVELMDVMQSITSGAVSAGGGALAGGAASAETAAEAAAATPYLLNSFLNLDMHNNCRHAAVRLLDYTLGNRTYTSKMFFRGLDHTTTMPGGAPSAEQAFYILPLAPSQLGKDYDRPTLLVLTKLHQRLIDIHTSDPYQATAGHERGYSEATDHKFKIIKQFYLDIAQQQQHTPAELIAKIDAFTTTHGGALSEHRNRGLVNFVFGFKTATDYLFRDLKTELTAMNGAQLSTKAMILSRYHF